MTTVMINDELYTTEESFFELDPHDKACSKIYYDEIRYYPVLTKEEELALFIKWKKHNDFTAKERLIKCNLRYVYKVAIKTYMKLQHTTSLLKLEDFIQEGNIGLLLAIDKFDYTKGYRLISYATQYIQGAMYQIFKEKDRLIRVPNNIEENYRKILKSYKFISKHSNKKINIENISSFTGIPSKEVERTLNYIKTNVYLDQQASDNSSKQEGSSKTLGDLIEDKATSDIMEMIIEENMQSEKFKFLNSLNYVERNIILQKYNPHGKMVTDEELALINNMSVNDVKQNIQRATRKLRQNQKRPLY